MAYQPYFTISPALLSLVEEIAALRESILGSPVGLSWIPALQKDRAGYHIFMLSVFWLIYSELQRALLATF